MFCRNCGKPIKDGASFCTECGWKVVNNVNDAGTNVSDPVMPDNKIGDSGTAISNNVPPIRNMNTESRSVRDIRPVNTGRRPAPVPAKRKGSTVAIVLATIFGTVLAGIILIVVIALVSTKSDTDTDMGSVDKMTEERPAEIEDEGTVFEDTVDPEAIKQLLAILDELEETTDLYGEKFDNSKDRETLIDDGNKWFESIEDQYKRIQEIEGLPRNVRKASYDAYEMYLSAIESANKDMVFLQDVQELADMINTDDLVSTYYDMKEKVESTECPENMADSWKAINKSLDYLAESANREKQGGELEDALMIISLSNYLIRFSTVIENETDKILNIYNAELEFMAVQGNRVGLIVKEIRDVASLEPEEIKNYEFEYNVESVIEKVTYDHIISIYPSLYNTYESFLTVKLGCLQGSREIIIECEIPGLSQSMSQSYHIGAAMTAINIKPPASNEKLNLDTAKDTQIKVTVRDKIDGRVLDTQSFPVHVYSRNDFEWDSDEFGTITKDNILCFLTPDSKAITELKRNAIDILEDMSGGEMDALAGYQGPYFAADEDGDGKADNLGQAQYLTTYMQAAALMRSMSDMGVRYTNDTFSIDNAGQHILFPDQVLETKTGLCIETSLVIASALQSMRMHTCLIFPPGHAQVAVETWEGSGSYFLIETTALPNENSVFIDEANAMITNWGRECDNYPIAYLSKDEWAAYLIGEQDDFSDDCYVLDCGDGALLGMTPFAN